MNESMRGVLVRDFGDFRLENLPVPEIGENDILMKVVYSGICGGDKAIYKNKAPWKLSFPFIPGHEFAGEIADLGREVRKEGKYRVGDKITAELIIPCGKCFYCKNGKYNLCNDPRFLGSSLNGGWAEYMRIPGAAHIYKLPETVSIRDAATVEPLSCSLWAVERASLHFADTIVVCGLGPIGMGAVMAASLKSPRAIIAIDLDERLLPLAKEAGAGYAFNAKDSKLKSKIDEITEGVGPSVFIEASGSSDALEIGLDLLRKGGRMVVYGVYGKGANINWSIISEYKELTIVGGHLSPGMFPICLDLIEKGKLKANKLVTQILSLDEFRLGLELKERSKEAVVKVLLSC
jgi:L-iditol 2-dehydrogenase